MDKELSTFIVGRGSWIYFPYSYNRNIGKKTKQKQNYMTDTFVVL